MLNSTFIDLLCEKAGYKIKVRSTGQKRRKKICPVGMKPNEEGTACVPMRSLEKRNRRLGSKKTQRSIKMQGSALKTRRERKRKKAMRFRKALGVK